MVHPEELGKKVDPQNFVVLAPTGMGNFVPLRLQFNGNGHRNNTLAILAGPLKGEDGEEVALQIIESIEAALIKAGTLHDAFKREKDGTGRTDTLVIELTRRN